MDLTAPPSIDRMVHALSRLVHPAVIPDWGQRHPEAWAKERRLRIGRASALLGAEVSTVADAKRAGWRGVPSDAQSQALALRLPDGRVGVSREGELYPEERRSREVLRDHLHAVMRGEVPIAMPEGMPHLPEMCRAALRAEGLDPDGVERFAAAAGDLDMKVARRSFKSKFRLGSKREKHHRAEMREGRWEPSPLNHHRWTDAKFVLSLHPRLEITGRKLVLGVVLPDAVSASLAGRRVSELLSHPAVDALTITTVAVLPRNLVLTVE